MKMPTRMTTSERLFFQIEMRFIKLRHIINYEKFVKVLLRWLSLVSFHSLKLDYEKNIKLG